MATSISKLNNKSDTPVAYVGNGGGSTGWSSWAFPANSEHQFGWQVEINENCQVLLTKSGAYFIWDDGDWNIRCKKADHEAFILVHVNAPVPLNIELSVSENGEPSAKQL